MQEGKKYLSGNHKLYGCKTEVSVRPNGMAVSCSAHYPGSVEDISIMQEILENHRTRLENSNIESEFDDESGILYIHIRICGLF